MQAAGVRAKLGSLVTRADGQSSAARFRVRLAWLPLLLFFQGSAGCFLSAKGGRDLDIWWFAAGVALLVVGIRAFMTRADRGQSAELPAWRRFVDGVWIGLAVFLG